MEARQGKRRAELLDAVAVEVVEDNEPDRVGAGTSFDRAGSEAVDRRVRRGGDRYVFVEEEESDEEDEEANNLDTKLERFYEIVRRIRVMRETSSKANGTHCGASAPSPQKDPIHPPWTPKFCWEDFAPASNVGGIGSHVAAVHAPKEHAGPTMVNGKHKYVAVTCDIQRQPDSGDEAGNDAEQKKGCKNSVVVVDQRLSETGGSRSLLPVDCRGVGEEHEQGAGGSGPYAGSRGSSKGVASLELKLALW